MYAGYWIFSLQQVKLLYHCFAPVVSPFELRDLMTMSVGQVRLPLPAFGKL